MLSFLYLGSPETAMAAVSVLHIVLLRIKNGVISAAAATLPHNAILQFTVRMPASIAVLLRQLSTFLLCRQLSVMEE